MRVCITYDLFVEPAIEMVELPFIIGVIGDFAGKLHEPLPYLRNRQFVEIDSENFDEVLAAFNPRLQFSVENKLQNDGSQINVELNFKKLADFEPDRIIRQIEPLNEIVRNRHNFSDIDNLDQKLSAQLNEIIHHEDFKILEASWRGLRYLINNKGAYIRLKIRIMHVTKKEFLRDFEKSVEFYQSVIFKKVHDEEYGVFGGEPFGALIGNYEFSHCREDLFLLRGISQVAAAAQIPFMAAASPDFFQVDKFLDLSRKKIINIDPLSAEYSGWHKFRQSEEAKYVSLCLPHFLLREKYGEADSQTEAFHFTEEISSINDYLWGNAAFVFGAKLAQTFISDGWWARIDGTENGVMSGFPTVVVQNDDSLDEPTVRSSVDLVLSKIRTEILSEQGFNILSNSQKTGEAVFLSATACALSDQSGLDQSLPVTFAVSRFIQYLKVLIRIGIYFCSLSNYTRTAKYWTDDLKKWINHYCIEEEKICSERFPLAAADIKVIEDKSRGNGFLIAEIYIKPGFQFPKIKVGRKVILRDFN